MPTADRLPPNLEYGLRQIARRHRRRLRLMGGAKFAALLIAVLGLLALALPLAERAQWPFAPPIAAGLLALGWGGRRWLRPRPTPTVEELALLVDEHYPQLENLAISSVEVARSDADSEWIAAQILDRARRETGAIDLGRLTDTRPLRPLALGSALLAAAGLALLVGLVRHWDPVRIGRGFFTPLTPTAAFVVEPGDALVERGQAQTVWVREAPAAAAGALRWRQEGGDWQTAALLPGRSPHLRHFRFDDLRADVDYQVQLGRVRSPVYRLAVWTRPAVESIDLTYHYPDYLRRPPRAVADGGHIDGPEGAFVDFAVAVNKALAAAELVLHSGHRVPLARADDHTWRGRIELTADDRYHIALRDEEGRANATADAAGAARPAVYDIVVNADAPPRIRARHPRGDDEATPLEEIPFGFSASDDYGLADYGLQYEVAGRAPVRLSLKGDSTATAAEARHLLLLEELDLRPGDLVTWSFWAEDHKRDRAPYETLGDPYFLEIRPYARVFRRAVSDAGADAGRDGGGAADQKQIIIATWNLRREAADLDAGAFAERRDRIAAAQRQVLQGALAARPPPGREHLPAALAREVEGALLALESAAAPAPAPALSTALEHQRRAYRYLLQLAPQERQIAPAGGRDRGRGGADRRQGEIDALETSRRRDFSEEASTLGAELAAAEDARRGIEELARRQQLINEETARLVSELERDRENEEAQRRLEKLRQQQRQNLEALDRLGGQIASGDMEQGQARDARRQLDRARRQMGQSADHLADATPQRARAAGRRALEALERAGGELGQLSRGAAAERLAQLQQRLHTIRRAQGQLADEPAPRERLAEEFADFMAAAGELASQAARNQPLMARKLGDWLRRSSRAGVYEDLRQGAERIRYGSRQQLAGLDAQAAEKLALAAGGFDSLAHYLVADDLQARRRALGELDRIAGEWAEPRGPEQMGRFAAAGYRDLQQALRDAEDLLPADSPGRAGLGEIRGEVGAFGRRYRREGAVPSYDQVYDRAIAPLQLGAEALRRELARLRDRHGPLEGEDAVPSRYRASVAEYFKRLSALEGD